MENRTNIRSKTPIDDLVEKELKKGLEISRDPSNANLGDNAIRITQISSKWYHESCMICDFKFREGDKVRICPKCKIAIHQDQRYQLECWSNHFKNENNSLCPCGDIEIPNPENESIESSQEENIEERQIMTNEVYSEFTNGLGEYWTNFRDTSVKVRVASKGDKAYGKKCLICRFKIREGDRYIQCPNCNQVYFHSDIMRHLNCWNSWHGKEGRSYCPNSGLECIIPE